MSRSILTGLASLILYTAGVAGCDSGCQLPTTCPREEPVLNVFRYDVISERRGGLIVEHYHFIAENNNRVVERSFCSAHVTDILDGAINPGDRLELYTYSNDPMKRFLRGVPCIDKDAVNVYVNGTLLKLTD